MHWSDRSFTAWEKLALGCIFIPLTLAALLGLQGRELAYGTGLFNLSRQLGGSAGIAFLSTFLDHRIAFHRAVLVEHVSLYSTATMLRLKALQTGFIANGSSPAVAKQQALAVLDRIVQGQASVLAFEDAFLIIGLFFLSKTERHEVERFLFYRGLGKAPLPLSLSAAAGGTLTLSAEMPQGVRHLFILRVENGRGVYRYLPALGPGQTITEAIPSMTNSQPLSEFSRRIGDDLAARLTESGLYPKEARAMVNTWRTSYFQSDGVRVLFVLPQAWTDGFIPLTMQPEPQQVVRVMVGRLEMLTPEREKRAESAVRGLAVPDAAVRERAFALLRDQGRYVEPIIRRVQRTARNEGVRILCRRLLATDFVTELRAAVLSATDGSRLADDVTHVRAQLAALLRQVGLDDAARAEAKQVVAALQSRPAPPMTDNASRHYLRAYARAMEGLGDDRGATEWYGKFVRFGSQVRTCGGCHEDAGPRNMAWFRDWWAGRKYARYVTLTGQMERTVAENETAVNRRPDDTAAQMMLAYLYEAQGRKNRAVAMWAKVEAPDRKQAKGHATDRRPNPVVRRTR